MTLSQLHQFALLRTLPKIQLRRLLAQARTRDFKVGEPVFKKSEAADHIFFVVSGRVKIFCQSPARKRKTFAYLGAGDIFGEMGALLNGPRTASALAVAPSRLMILHNRDFRKFLLSDPNVTYSLLRTMAERLRSADEEIESLLFRNILGRVSKTLHDLARHCGKPYRRGLLLRERYTHQELADLVGTTREPLSRALTLLRNASLIEVREGNFFVPDLVKLSGLIRDAAHSAD
ncbi:MAG: Crp/Fnr family transcriptional regulator [Elusimicrobiota bacterium]|jgi:CRP/FNR family transcriptional regulator